MKNFKTITIFLIVLLLGIFSANAQNNKDDYHPLVEEGKVWSILTAKWDWPTPENPTGLFDYNTQYYMFYGDTSINESDYKKIYTSSKEEHIFPNDWNLYNSFMREDNDRKVWCLRSSAWGNQWEELLFDFSLQINDTIDNNMVPPLIVDDIIYKTMQNGEERKVYLFSTGGQVITDYWIEGIGSNVGLFITFSHSIAGGLYDMLCFHENGELLFLNETYQTCYKNTLNIVDYDATFDIFPNPANDIIYINNTKNININCILLINSNGQIIRQCEPNTDQINISNISPGIYFIKLSANNGEHIIKKVVIEK
ncbi:MAG: T9SS type A sorting domain-containing protein [Bacteroidales bacterium]|jgi:hypothetical protein|nr:T9SS type A sorting domain-containing protein [Bacteroidales bacterium]